MNTKTKAMLYDGLFIAELLLSAWVAIGNLLAKKKMIDQGKWDEIRADSEASYQRLMDTP